MRKTLIILALLLIGSRVALAGDMTAESYAHVKQVANHNGMKCTRKGKYVAFRLPANVINPRNKKGKSEWQGLARLMKSKLGDNAVVIIFDYKGYKLADSL